MEISDIKKALGLENLDPEDIDRIKLQLQQINDTIQGGLRSANLKEYRNTYVINAQDSLDATYPMYVHFNIISEMTKIVSIKLSFWLLNFRAYSTAAKEKAAVTSGASSASSSASGGGPTSGASGSASGGGGTSGATGTFEGVSKITVTTEHNGGYLLLTWESITVPTSAHTHSTPHHIHPEHSHSVPAHTHNIPHTHSVPAHAHDIDFGIHEEETSPTIVPSISRDNGLTWSLPIGSYTKDQELDITRFIDTAGSKMIKFTSTTRARLSVQVTIKLDIKAR